MHKVDLNVKWHLAGMSPEGEGFEITADVPGSTLYAILNSDIEKNLDVFYRDNAEKVQQYEKYDWIYSKTFEIEETDKKLMLTFEKLDTYCDIYINDKHLGHCDNGYISHKFDISKLVNKGKNKICIYFYSPVTHARGRKVRPCAFAASERLYTRRVQCTYGWDWTMRFVSCGIGNAYIEEIDAGIKVESAYVYTKSIDEDSAEIVIDIDFKDFESGGIVDVNITDPGGIRLQHIPVITKNRSCG